MKGDISGGELLRHGEKHGSVTLTFVINKKEIIVKRTLKRGSAGIVQESGYIIIDDVKTDLVATELKARILELLGYSQSWLKRSKSLIYRYTVYTPQEEMKRIILSKPDERLDTLRSVFGVDKYKTIRENTTNYARELKRKISYANGQVQDLDEIKKNLEEKKKTKELVSLDVEKQTPITKKAKADIENKKKDVLQLEKEIEKIREISNNITLLNQKIIHAKESIETGEKSRIDFLEQIKKTEDELLDQRKVNEEKLKERMISITKNLEQEQEKIIEKNKKVAELEFIEREAQKLKEQIMTLTKCPTCMQDVTSDHKHRIDDENKGKVFEAKKSLEKLEHEKKDLMGKINLLQSKLKEYDDIQKKHEIFKLKQTILEEKKKSVLAFQKNVEEQKQKQKSFEKEKEEQEKILKGKETVTKEFSKVKFEFEKLQIKEREEDIKLARLKEQKISIESIISGLKEQITLKEGVKKKISKMNAVYNFLTDFFENLVVSMEKHVMASIYHEFNELVTKWFSSLIGDETITIRLDNDFTPTLEQNGYETEIQNLSGGEKTAVALAYRLALNKVINDMISGINTKDLIILDEPTDGFSSEQLDRVREVIDELELKQILIVSHESQIESFVDSVIRISKEDHVSKVVG